VIELYTAGTPNGWKVSMALEEMALPYRVNLINLGKGEQRSPDYLKICPNGRIPAIVDADTGISVFESGAILLYLAEKSGKLLPTTLAERYDVIQWLMFQMAGIGPMQGQAVAFVRYFPEEVPQAISRYRNESRRLYEVLERRLSDREYLADEYSIADIANYSWVRSYYWARVDIDGLDNLQAWMQRMADKPGIQRGCEIPQGAKSAADLKKGGASITTT
jgi:GST-like protein